MLKRAGFVAYVVVSSLLLLLLIETGAHYYLKSTGLSTPFLFQKTRNKIRALGDNRELYGTFDPHIGYAHGANEAGVRELSPEFTWLDGFVVYSNRTANFERPVVLALGGSTTDGVIYGHSWPEELSRLLKDNKLPGTVINGGVGGYSTNQELLKLMRDGLEFSPNLVVSYSGINDRGTYSKLPYPMVHNYQRDVIDMLQGKTSPVFPSTIELLKRITGSFGGNEFSYTYGTKSHRTLAEQYRRNLELMDAMAESQGSKFRAFIQPFAFYRSRHSVNVSPDKKGPDYIEAVRTLYDEITKLPQSRPYVHDFTGILENDDNVYKEDGVHLTRNGDKAVARAVFNSIKSVMVSGAGESRSPPAQ